MNDTLTDKQVEYLTEHVQVLRLEPGDIIVFRCRGPLPTRAVEGIRKAVQCAWPEHKVVVLEDDATLGVVRHSQGGGGA